MSSRVALPVAVVFAVVFAAAGATTADAAEVHTDLAPVHACAATDGGVLAATDGGLALLAADASPRRVWTARDGLAGTRTYTVLAAGEGAVQSAAGRSAELWIGGEDGLVRARRVGERLRVIRRIASAPVRALVRHDGQIYAGTWGGGVARVAGDRLVPVRFAGSPAKTASRVTALVTWRGALIAATAGAGVYYLDDRARLRPLGVALAQAAPLRSALAWTLRAEGDTLWLGTVDGLWSVTGQPAAARARRIAAGDVRGLGQLDGQLVAATFGDGVRAIRGGLAVVRGLPSGVRFSYAAGGDGDGACIGGHESLWVRSGGQWRATPLLGPPGNDVAALAIDDRNRRPRVWVGTFDRGLAVYEDGAWRRVRDPLIDDKINALAVADGALWVATAAGLSVVSDRGDVVARLTERDGLPSRHVLTVTALRGGGVLVGTSRGVAIIRDGRPIALGSKQGLRSGNVWAAAEDADGWIWLGTTRGLFRGRADGPWRRLSPATGHLRDEWVMALAIRDGAVYAGTYKGGVTRLNAEACSAGDGACDDAQITATHLGEGWVNPGGLAFRGDALYAATMDGLRVGDGDAATWRDAGVRGVGKDTTAIAPSRAGLWIGSRRGLLRVAP